MSDTKNTDIEALMERVAKLEVASKRFGMLRASLRVLAARVDALELGDVATEEDEEQARQGPSFEELESEWWNR